VAPVPGGRAAWRGPPPPGPAGPAPGGGPPLRGGEGGGGGGGRSTISVAACGSRGPRSLPSPSPPRRRCKSRSNSDLLPRMMIRPMQPQRPCSSSTDSVLLFLPPVNNANLWIKETPCYLNPIHDDLFQVRILSANPFPSSLLILLNPIRCVASLSPLQVNYKS